MWEETRQALTPINLAMIHDWDQLQNLLLDLVAAETKYQIQLSGQAVSSYYALLMCDYACRNNLIVFKLFDAKDP